METFLLAFRRFTGCRSLPQIVVSENAFTYLAAADELQQLLKSEHLTEALGRRCTVAVYPKACPLVWWVVGAPYRINEDVLEESPGESKNQFSCVTDTSSRSRGHPQWQTSDTCFIRFRRCWATHTSSPPTWSSDLPHKVVEEQDLTDPTYGSITDVSQRAQLQAFLLNQFQAHWTYKYLTSLREYHKTTGNNSQKIKPGDIVLMYDESPRSTVHGS